MGALSLHSFTADYIDKLAKAGVDPAWLIEVETYLVLVLDQADRRRRVSFLLETQGPTKAAQIMGVSRQWMHELAKRVPDKTISDHLTRRLTTAG